MDSVTAASRTFSISISANSSLTLARWLLLEPRLRSLADTPAGAGLASAEVARGVSLSFVEPYLLDYRVAPNSPGAAYVIMARTIMT